MFVTQRLARMSVQAHALADSGCQVERLVPQTLLPPKRLFQSGITS
jgi:hypothetical protein